VLLNGINHIALISRDIDRLRVFYTEVFDTVRSVFFRDPDGLEGEVLVAN
jgi:catechol 2,3-dioxygenase-like lactoylglutathione lyase family enzyme